MTKKQVLREVARLRTLSLTIQDIMRTAPDGKMLREMGLAKYCKIYLNAISLKEAIDSIDVDIKKSA